MPNLLPRFAAPVVHRQRRAFAATACLILALIGAPQASTLTVTNLDDAGGGSLRDAIATAVPGDTIVFQTGLSGTITLASSLSVTVPLTIQGAGASISLSGNDTVRIMTVSADLTISNLAFTAGKISAGGGGAINHTAGTLTVSDCSFVANTADNGGAIFSRAGATLSVDRSSFADNAATGIGGGGIITLTAATVTNSTFTSNSAPNSGGGINVQPAGTVTLINDTFSGNLASGAGGALSNLGISSAINTTFSSNQAGGGAAILTSNSNLTIENSVFADNASSAGNGALVFLAPGGTTSHNVFFNNTNGGVPDDGAGYGTSNFVVATSQPLLPLANYGGPTLTQLPVVDGAAICAGSVPLVPPGTTTDQRGPGFPRTRLNGATPCVDAGATQQPSTTTTVTSTTNPSVFGQSVTFTATVAPQSGPGTPSGSVTFTIDGVDQTPVTLAGGQASFTPSALSVGAHPVSADYGGSASYVASSGSLAGGQIVTAAPVAATITKVFTPSTVVLNGTSVATITVTNPNAFPITNVQFSDTMPAGIDLITQTGGTCSTPATGGGMFTINPGTERFSSTSYILAPGQSCTITVSVRGIALGAHVNTTSPVTSSDAPAGTAASGTLTVNKPATNTTLSSSVNPSTFGQAVTFTATVTVVAPGSGTPTGTATFNDGATTLGTGTLNGSGVATFTTTSLSVDTHGITAVYAGDTTFATSTSSALSQTVNQSSTTTTLSSSVNPSTFGQAVTFTATVTAAAPGSGTPTGTATFKDGATTIGTGTLNGGGVATFTTPALSAGPHSMTVAYGADANFLTSASSPVSQGVGKSDQTIAFGALGVQTFGDAPFTVSATASSGLTAFTFLSSSTAVCTVAGNEVTIVAAGSCVLTADQGGNDNYNAAPQATATVTIGTSEQTIAFAVLPNRLVDNPAFPVSATASSGLPVAFASQTLSTCTMNGGMVTLHATGTCTIAASQSGSGNYTAAGSVLRSFLVAANCARTVVGPAQLALGVVALPYSQTLTLAGASAPASFTMSGSLPPGVTFSDGVLSGTPTSPGAFPIAVTATGADGCQATTSYAVAISRERRLVVGSGADGPAAVRAFTLAGGPVVDLAPYGSFSGGVSVAQGDTNGDGIADIITGAGRTGGPGVTVVDGATGVVRLAFFAFNPATNAGIEVAAGDITGDGVAEILATQGCTGAPVVRAFDGRTGTLVREYPIVTPAWSCGLHLAAADINGDGVADLVAGSGGIGPPFVVVVSGWTGAVIRDFFAYDVNFGGGVHVAAGDVTGDGFADIITGAGTGGGPHVQVFDGVSGAAIRGFMAYDPAFAGGVRVGAGDLNGDGRAEVITGAGPGGGPHVRVWDGAGGTEIFGAIAFESSGMGGIFVAGPPAIGRMAVDIPSTGASGTAVRIAGWALNESTGTVGTDAIHAWAVPVAGGSPTFVGAATTRGPRFDVAAIVGGEFLLSGFDFTGTLPPGIYDLIVYARNSRTLLFDQARVIRITVN